MPIGNQGRAPRAVLGSLAILLHTAFALLAIAPPVALCHRADGGTALELAGPWATCACAECEHCQARISEPGAPASPGASVAPCRCGHEPIRLATARSLVRRDDGTRNIHPSLAPEARPFEPAASPRDAVPPQPVWAGPPSAAAGAAGLLRC